jgi:hypothetical protein
MSSQASGGKWRQNGADSEEKREPVSDIDTAGKPESLTQTGRLEKRTSLGIDAGSVGSE